MADFFGSEGPATEDTWVAISHGALDISRLPSAAQAGIDVMVLPTEPSEPIGLEHDVAAFWRRLVDGPVRNADLSDGERALVREFEHFGLVSSDPHHVARTSSLPQPWLSSPLHELVYSLVTHLAVAADITTIFIKGPALHRQGLREREDSGDVDVLVEASRLDDLASALGDWGWTRGPSVLGDTRFTHSASMRPGLWGCEVDLHRHFPGVGVDPATALEIIGASSECMSFAGTPAVVPERSLHAVLSALHLARPSPGLPASGTGQAASQLVRGGEATMGAAQRLRADAALSEAFANAYPESFSRPAYDSPDNWQWLTQPNAVAAYASLLRLASQAERLTLLRRILWPPPHTLPDDVGDNLGLFGPRWRRLGRGIREILWP